MSDLVTEIWMYLAAAAVLGLAIGYLIWGWGRSAAVAAAKAEGAATARTSVDGNAPLREQLDNALDERDALKRELDRMGGLKAEPKALPKPTPPRAQPAANVFGRGNWAKTTAPASLSVLRKFPKVRENATVEQTARPSKTSEKIAEATHRRPASLLDAMPEHVDDLKRIKGVGPKLEELLNSKGIYLFKQVAQFSDADVAWVNEEIEAFPGRIARDNWVAQAQELFLEKYGKNHDT